MAWDDDYSARATRDTDDPNSFADVNQLQTNIGFLKNSMLGTASKTANYTVTDSDGLFLIYINPSSGDVTITLPTLADNQDRQLYFIVSDLGGKVTIDGEGAETIGGYSSLVMQSKNDHLHIVGESGEWQIISYYAKYDTGWQNRSDWTNVHLGSSTFDYDNLAGSFTVGEVITEETSGNTGIIQSDTGSTLVLKNVTGTGIWTDGREVTGSDSGATADVNEGGGSNKNQDTNILHDFGIHLPYLKMEAYMSKNTTGTDATAFRLADHCRGDYYGISMQGEFRFVDNDNVQLQTADWGYYIVEDNGTSTQIDTEDYSIKIIIEVII